MGNFLSALVDIFSNESAYRNAIIVAVVLLFAASGELIAEKAGTINISIEAMMLAGAYGAAVGQDTGGVWLGLLMAVAAGLVVSAVQANTLGSGSPLTWNTTWNGGSSRISRMVPAVV